jgi:hypothetical protein
LTVVSCREASRKASLMMDSSSLDESREPLRLPAFEKAVMQSVTRALELWRDEAMEGESPPLTAQLHAVVGEGTSRPKS